ncbi:GGDEF domain-containing protein [Butyrivibrio proteoclasticus]|uniref:GGDEF domain-containing protein n=1 Tax=Butyrivibrio proteoclasticus TaxID=43305 RepID=UPI00047E3290|nr:GGDEF domain-containing protein [Butyrivibrio proteoclasticus]
MEALNKLWKKLLPKNKQEINDIIDKGNMSSIRAMCLVTIFSESFVVLRYYVTYRDNFYINMTTAFAIAVIISCIIMAILADLLVRGIIHGHKLSVSIVLAFILIISLFAMYTSYTNYRMGRQIIVLFVASVAITSFIQITPLYHMILLLIEFIILYSLLYAYDGAKNMVFLNAFAYLVVILIVCVISYHRKNDSIIAAYEAKMRAEDYYIKSSEDQLTGLMNRFALDSITIKNEKTFCVAMTDIDFFKTINDSFGHIKGDEVIKMTASKLLELFRKNDCFRYGGDEFLILTTKLDENAFKKRMEDWEKLVEETRIEGIDSAIKISYGIAVGVVNSNEDLLALIKDADNKLYTIKKQRHENS